MPRLQLNSAGGHSTPVLLVNKTERTKLSQAAKVCGDIETFTVGCHIELSDAAGKLAEQLVKLAAIAEHDLSKPF